MRLAAALLSTQYFVLHTSNPLSGFDLQIVLVEDSDVRQVSVLLVVVEAVADHELRSDREGDVLDVDGHRTLPASGWRVS